MRKLVAGTWWHHGIRESCLERLKIKHINGRSEMIQWLSQWEDDRRILTATWRQRMCRKGERVKEIKRKQGGANPIVVVVSQWKYDHPLVIADQWLMMSWLRYHPVGSKGESRCATWWSVKSCHRSSESILFWSAPLAISTTCLGATPKTHWNNTLLGAHHQISVGVFWRYVDNPIRRCASCKLSA